MTVVVATIDEEGRRGVDGDLYSKESTWQCLTGPVLNENDSDNLKHLGFGMMAGKDVDVAVEGIFKKMVRVLGSLELGGQDFASFRKWQLGFWVLMVGWITERRKK